MTSCAWDAERGQAVVGARGGWSVVERDVVVTVDEAGVHIIGSVAVGRQRMVLSRPIDDVPRQRVDWSHTQVLRPMACGW